MTTGAPWAILTGEFPPQCGGVGDYTAQLAASLADAGDPVTVFRPPDNHPPSSSPHVEVVTLRDHFGPAARAEISRRLDRARARVLVQYVPQAFGMRGLNVPFCRWVRSRFQRSDDVRVMFHEPYLYFTAHPGHAAVAAFQRAMAAILLRASSRVYVSTDAWVRYLRPYAPRRFNAVTLPIPSAIPCVSRPASVAAMRGRFLTPGTSSIIGHFGTYGNHIAPLVKDALMSILLSDPSVAAVCMGANSREFARRLVRSAPALEARIHATGHLAAEEASIHFQSCDLLVQPYPDGVTTRRTSIMAALANGRPVVTTAGDLTEPVWRQSKAVALVPAGDRDALADAVRQLVRDAAARASLGSVATSLYNTEFAIERTVSILRDTAPQSAAPLQIR